MGKLRNNNKKDVTLSDILLEIVRAMPPGFVFDSIFILRRIEESYPQEHWDFLNIFADAKNPDDMAADELDRMLKICEPAVVTELDFKIHFPRTGVSLRSHRLWKKN